MTVSPFVWGGALARRVPFLKIQGASFVTRPVGRQREAKDSTLDRCRGSCPGSHITQVVRLAFVRGEQLDKRTEKDAVHLVRRMARLETISRIGSAVGADDHRSVRRNSLAGFAVRPDDRVATF